MCLASPFPGAPHAVNAYLSYVLPILLLVGSNVFMTFAWYGHLRFKEVPLVAVMLASWGIALFEYCMAVPANRWGSEVYSTAQLKTIQEVVTLVVFAGFSVVYLKEPITWNYAIGFSLVAAGAYFIFRGPL
ncbi:MAG TPA: DMT family protein [Xanthobacteraceae bacterium]|nr:DMT family protein [Xanthobacteraceae bacterium]